MYPKSKAKPISVPVTPLLLSKSLPLVVKDSINTTIPNKTTYTISYGRKFLNVLRILPLTENSAT